MTNNDVVTELFYDVSNIPYGKSTIMTLATVLFTDVHGDVHG